MRMQLTPLAFLLVGTSVAFANTDYPMPGMVDLGCTEFDRFEDLTPNDTLSLIVNVHNAEQAQGYLIVSAADETGEHISFNNLIGHTMVLNGINHFEYAVNPFDYRSPVTHGEATDLNGDGNRDLDVNEYERTGAEILVPRFLGAPTMPGYPSMGGGYGSELIMIALSGGTAFDTTVDFLIYNDNEEVFSSEHTFNCWTKVGLTQVSNAFTSQFLSTTDHDDSESLGGRESGWFSMKGGVANSISHSIAHPSIAAVYLERAGMFTAADLPFEMGLADGSLLPRTPQGGLTPASPAPIDPTGTVQRRQPASLLLFPEFDSRQGIVTLITVTNTNPTEDVRAHYVYVGKYGEIM